MDYARLRAAALREGEAEEAVTVDTRALIDKVLARYSGEWTTLRELIQNAADAQATKVTIKFETLPSTSVPLPSSTNPSELLKHTITNHTLRRLLVKNDGQPFTKTDWGRLKRIAEGNPDETKIGAFGVGFYSVFADCEEPFISSGSEAMAFYWKGNALFTRKLQLPDDQKSSDTAFVLDYRNTTTPLPNLLSVSQFLATSLTFVALQEIEFWIDDWKILSLRKKSSPAVNVPIPKDFETKTKEGLMRVSTVDRTSTQIDAAFMGVVGWKPRNLSAIGKVSESYGLPSENSLRNFFSRLATSSTQSNPRAREQKEAVAVQDAISEDVTKISTSTIFLGVTAASVTANVSAAFSKELERATKKPPPKTTKLAILTSSYDESVASESSSGLNAVAQTVDVFASVLPSKKPGGRIFIGFPTTQTTGAGMHISAPSVIPTVEREAIDLNARWVRTWNVEMLRASGIMTRLAFANEMAELDRKLKRYMQPSGKLKAEDIDKFVPEALHILKTFTFTDSTPSAQVAQVIEEAFWTSYKQAHIEVFSSRGILNSSKVRIDSEELSKFVDTIPVIPKGTKESPFIKKLIDFGLVSHITVDDVRKELEAKAMNKEQLVNFIQWASRKALTGELDPPSKANLLDVAVAMVGEGSDQGDIITLGTITNFLSTNKIPADMPLPPTTIPHALTSSCKPAELQALGWETLEIVPWLRFLIESAGRTKDEQNITKSPKFAAQVLHVLSKNFEALSMSSRQTVTTILQANTVMPTKLGMRKPEESFFPVVKLFDDLPTIQYCEKVKEKFLVAIGVRKTVDLDTIFTRLLNPSAGGERKWSHMELIKYLASVKDDIPSGDLKKLKETRFCPAEAGPKGMEPTKASDKLYKVSELFEPKDSIRPLHLPILQWPGPPGSFRPSSAEGRFLAGLGLRQYPSVPELVEMMASPDEALRTSAMVYFIGNHHLNRYAEFRLDNSPKSFLPVQGNEKKLVPPSGCFTNQGAAILGFPILRQDLHDHASKFGVARDPPIGECVRRLQVSPPSDRKMAITLFTYFASRLGDLGETDITRLRSSRIVPLARRRQSSANGSAKSGEATPSQTHVSPRDCYLGSSSAYEEIFDFVDFGRDANLFLSKCGAKDEPSNIEIAELACDQPARLFNVLGTNKYLNLLRHLAADLAKLKRDKELFRKMKMSPFLLAYQELVRPSKEKLIEIEDEDDAPIRHYLQAESARIVVKDDIIAFRLFKENLLVCPEEDILEEFYEALGSSPLSNMVEESPRLGSRAEKQDQAVALKSHVVERSTIFLHDYSAHRRDFIKHDAKWLEKSLSIETRKGVALRRSLRGHTSSHTERRYAVLHSDQNRHVLYISADGPRDMYQVGQALCQLLLNRPSPQNYISFEPVLTLDLAGLRARGYNVDRILRRKAAEERVAEEERRKALEAEQQRIRERKREHEMQAKAAEAARQEAPRPKSPQATMPGTFSDDAPEEPSQAGRRKNKGLFSQWSKRLGFETDTDSEPDEPEPEPAKAVNGNAGPSKPPKHGRGPSDDGRVTNPAVVQQNLLNAVKATRAHGSDKLFSPPQASEVKEQATYCDETPAQNLRLAAETADGTKVYMGRDMAEDAGAFLARAGQAANAFAQLLGEVGGVYALPPRAVHVFYDEAGGTIAFNSGGSVFCNLRFFLQLHWPAMEGAAAGSAARGKAKADAGVWWWVVMAHELAHNLVKPHNSEHSYYTESFIQQYFPQMVAQTIQWRAQTNAPVVPKAPPPYSTSDPRWRPAQ